MRAYRLMDMTQWLRSERLDALQGLVLLVQLIKVKEKVRIV